MANMNKFLVMATDYVCCSLMWCLRHEVLSIFAICGQYSVTELENVVFLNCRRNRLINNYEVRCNKNYEAMGCLKIVFAYLRFEWYLFGFIGRFMVIGFWIICLLACLKIKFVYSSYVIGLGDLAYLSLSFQSWLVVRKSIRQFISFYLNS